MTLLARFGFLLLAACFSTAAQVDESVELDTMQVTAGRQPESQYQVPQPVTVITREEIERENIQVMTEAFRYEPGAFFQQTGPGQGIVIVRGLKGAGVLHLVDGMRLNNAFFRTAPSQYIALVDPQNIEQLELLRGPYGTVYGSDAMGGVVQVLTPEYRFDGDGLSLQGGVKTHYASADLARTGRVYAAAGDREFSVSGGFSFAEYGQRLLPEPGQSPNGAGATTLDDRVNGTDYLSRGYDFKTLWTPGGPHELMFSAQYFELPALPRYNELVEGYGPLQTPPATAPVAMVSVYDNNRAFYHLRYRYNAPLAFMDSIEIHAAEQVINDDRLDRTNANPGRNVFEYNRSSLSGLTAQAQTQVGSDYSLLYGIEVYQDRVDSRTKRETPPGSGAFTFNSTTGFQSRFPDGSRAENYGAYMVNEWRFLDRWLVDLGGRYNRTRTVLPLADRLLAATLTDDDFAGSLGTRYALTPAVAWTVNAGRGYRAPNINDLAQTGARAGGRVVVANLALKPESIFSADTGLKWLEGGWQGEATVFYSDYKDRITLIQDVFAPGQGDCPGNTLPANNTTNCSQNQNISEAIYYGFEGGLRYAFSPMWTVRSTLNYTFGQQEANGVKGPGNRVPPLNGQLGVIYTPVPAFTIEPNVFFADRQDRLDATDKADRRINPNGTPGYAVLNLALRYVPFDGLELQLGGTNLLDKSYREHGSGIDGQARGVVAGLRARFD